MRLLIMVLALVLVGGQATTVDLIREEPLDVRLDWLSLQADGAVVVTRSSPVRLGPRATTVPIVKSADSFLRFNYPGMSPRTVSATTIPSKGTFRAPDPLAGGELMLTVRNAQVVPVRARIVGPRVTTTRNIEGRSAVIAGVMPGEYVVTPIYMGDFAGSPIRVLVGHAQTAAAILDQQAAGAAHIRLERSLCAEHTGIAIFSTQGTRRKVHEMPPARCESGVGGLMPGKYEVHLPLARRGVRTAVFEIKSQRTTEVVVMEFPVVARGQVSLGHKSAAETEVSFRHLEPADGTSPSFSVSTGPDGTYEAGLNAAGLYLVRIRRGLYVRGAPRPHCDRLQQAGLETRRRLYNREGPRTELARCRNAPHRRSKITLGAVESWRSAAGHVRRPAARCVPAASAGPWPRTAGVPIRREPPCLPVGSDADLGQNGASLKTPTALR